MRHTTQWERPYRGLIKRIGGEEATSGPLKGDPSLDTKNLNGPLEEVSSITPLSSIVNM
jgi:hypothetical protein